MAAESPVATNTEQASSPRRYAARAARHLKAQVEDWYDECRYLAAWEDEHLVDKKTPERLAEHARLLDELERVGRWLLSATKSSDFPESTTAELVTLTLQDLSDTRAMWHGKNLDEKGRAAILKSCFNES